MKTLPGAAGGAVATIVHAAAAAQMKLHLGLAHNTFLYGHGQPYPWFNNEKATSSYAQLQVRLATRLHQLFGHTGVVEGFYTEVEESNSLHWRPQLTAFATQYLGPVATSIRELDRDLVVWASPYNVGNRTRYPASKYMSPAQIGESWRQAFEAAPDFGFVAPQDSTGGQGNSLAVALDFLRGIGSAAKLANRTTWANAEIFEYWPRSCVWTPSDHCKGRHPAPWERIQQHIAAEAPIVKALGGKLIAWEWFGDLSPNAQAAGIVPESRASAAGENYKSYLAYVRPSARPARASALKPLKRRPIKVDEAATPPHLVFILTDE